MFRPERPEISVAVVFRGYAGNSVVGHGGEVSTQCRCYSHLIAFAVRGTALLRRTFWAYAVIFCCWDLPVQAAGIQLFNGDSGWSGAIWYPCAREPKHVQLGDLGVAVD
jgi:hypothetical protein